jgi:hypothetical protein
MPRTLAELIAPYPTASLATAADNDEILDFFDRIDMKTDRGGISFSRRPDFFALQRAQAERTFTFLFRNPDRELSGVAVYAITQMMVKGKLEPVAYTCDMRLSPRINRRARIHFRDLYVDITKHCHEVDEFLGTRFIITSILDENTAAINSLVSKKDGKAGEMLYRPVFPYQNLTILGRLPLVRLGSPRRAVRCPGSRVEDLQTFLLSNPEQSEITLSAHELERKKTLLAFSWEDFLVVFNHAGEIVAASLLVTDEAYRKLVLKGIGAGLKAVGQAMPLLGKPAFHEGAPLRTSYLGFLKIAATTIQERADLLASLLHLCLDLDRRVPLPQRFHNLIVMDAQANRMDQQLRLRGFLTLSLPATLYQVIHRQDFTKKNLLRAHPARRADFEVAFA